MTDDQFKRMLSWGFTELHLRLTWEHLISVPEQEKDFFRKDFIPKFTVDKDKIFEKSLKGEKCGLFIYSQQTGNGKTALIHQIAKDIVSSKIAVRKMVYLTGVAMFFELKKTFNPNGGMNESDILDSILACDVFFLDDFDKLIRWSNYEKERATLIIDTRYSHLRPIIITSNKSLDEMLSLNLIEKHLHSRLTEMCQEVQVSSKEDYRLKTRVKTKIVTKDWVK